MRARSPSVERRRDGPRRAVRISALSHGSRELPAVAFTFDDGPGDVTAAVLEILARHGATATFDVLGERIAGREEVLRRIAAAHEVGVHGWRHEDHRRRPAAHARQAAAAATAVRSVTGVRPGVFRPPFGLWNRRLVLAAALRGLATVVWDVDPRDFEEPPAAAIRDRILAGLRPGAIVLLHDDRPELAATADALDAVLEELPARGLRTATVSELVRAARPGPGPSSRPSPSRRAEPSPPRGRPRRASRRPRCGRRGR
jgi:peptidoglycan/xylan/chitin deacetylase (PgdA/CDA1 family)